MDFFKEQFQIFLVNLATVCGILYGYGIIMDATSLPEYLFGLPLLITGLYLFHTLVVKTVDDLIIMIESMGIMEMVENAKKGNINIGLIQKIDIKE